MRFAIFMIILTWLSSAAYIYGDVYQASTLEKVNNSVIKVDGRFSYQMVNTKPNYSLELPEGDYSISAEKYDNLGNTILYAKENIRLGNEDQRIDLVLKPKDDIILFYMFIGAIILIILIILFIFKIKTKEQKEPAQEKLIQRQIKLDKEAKKVLQALENSEGRSTQKELKQTLNFSDAKLSLILSELEAGAYIKKFKRGRGNIIRKL